MTSRFGNACSLDVATGRVALPAAGDLPLEYLHAGRVIVSPSPCRVTTILGSCVAVGIWDPDTGIGGLNHFLLPHSTVDHKGSTRFSEAAMHALIEGVVAAGARRQGLLAKVFGGACILTSFQANGSHLGAQNVKAARRVLLEARIPVAAEDVEGERGRKLTFQTHDGSAWVLAL